MIYAFKITYSILLTLSTFILCSDGLLTEPLLKDFEYHEGKTKCSKYLLQGDTIVVHGNVTFVDLNYVKLNQSKGILKLWWENNSSDKKRKRQEELYFHECDQPDNENSSFQCTSYDNLMKTVYTETVTNYFSEAFLQLEVIYNGTHHNSNCIKLPKVYNLTDIQMTINKKKVDLDDSPINIKGSEIELCCSDAPSPCNAEITPPNSNPIRNISSLCVTYTHASYTSGNFTFAIQVCGSYMQNVTKTIIFNVNVEYYADIQMTINGEKLQLDNSPIVLNSIQITLCCTEVPSPCIAVLKPPNSPAITNKTCVTYTHVSKTRGNFTFGYQNNNISKNYTKEITFNVNEDNKKEDGPNFAIALGLGLGLGLPGAGAIIALVYYVWKRIQLYLNAKKNDAPPVKYQPNNPDQQISGTPGHGEHSTESINNAKKANAGKSTNSDKRDKRTKSVEIGEIDDIDESDKSVKRIKSANTAKSTNSIKSGEIDEIDESVKSVKSTKDALSTSEIEPFIETSSNTNRPIEASVSR